MALSNFEISKTLTESDITDKKVGLPVTIVRHMNPIMNGKNSKELTAVDIWKQPWPLNYYTRPTGNKKGPVFTTGWHKFVEANDVRAGDKLIFSGHQVAGEMPYYMIQVKRQTMTIEGKIVDVDVIKTVQGEPVNYL